MLGLHLLADTALQGAPRTEPVNDEGREESKTQHAVLLPDHYPQFQPSSLMSERHSPAAGESFSEDSTSTTSRRQSQRVSKRKKCAVNNCQFFYFEEGKLEEHMKRAHEGQEMQESAKRRKSESTTSTPQSPPTPLPPAPAPVEEAKVVSSASSAHDQELHFMHDIFDMRSVSPVPVCLPPLRRVPTPPNTYGMAQTPHQGTIQMFFNQNSPIKPVPRKPPTGHVSIDTLVRNKSNALRCESPIFGFGDNLGSFEEPYEDKKHIGNISLDSDPIDYDPYRHHIHSRWLSPVPSPISFSTPPQTTPSPIPLHCFSPTNLIDTIPPNPQNHPYENEYQMYMKHSEGDDGTYFGSGNDFLQQNQPQQYFSQNPPSATLHHSPTHYFHQSQGSQESQFHGNQGGQIPGNQGGQFHGSGHYTGFHQIQGNVEQWHGQGHFQVQQQFQENYHQHQQQGQQSANGSGQQQQGGGGGGGGGHGGQSREQQQRSLLNRPPQSMKFVA